MHSHQRAECKKNKFRDHDFIKVANIFLEATLIFFQKICIWQKPVRSCADRQVRFAKNIYGQLSRRGKVKIKLNELSALPKELIRGRIAAGLTQTQLAQRLGLKTQQIQKYEANDYAMASYTRLMEIAQALHQAASERQVNQVR